MLFSLWPRDRVTAAILEIEENLAAGIQSASSPREGSIAYASQDDARRILRALYRRHGEITGVKQRRVDAPRIYPLRRRQEF